MAISEREKTAVRLFASGVNCAQAVLMTYADIAGLTQEQAARVACGLGGGIGRLRDNCGAFSSAVMLWGRRREARAPPADVRAGAARLPGVHRPKRQHLLRGAVRAREEAGIPHPGCADKRVLQQPPMRENHPHGLQNH